MKIQELIDEMESKRDSIKHEKGEGAIVILYSKEQEGELFGIMKGNGHDLANMLYTSCTNSQILSAAIHAVSYALKENESVKDFMDKGFKA